MPKFSSEEIESFRGLSFAAMALKIFLKFVGPDDIPAEDLEKLTQKAYGPGSNFVVDSTRPFTLVTQFVTHNGEASSPCLPAALCVAPNRSCARR